jgi:glycosyltransferase involved in cell wall biosynthesis
MNRSGRKISVLHLARWYPHRYDPMPGLFIQRHAEAIAPYACAAVVYAHGVKPEGQKIPLYEVVVEEKNGVRTVRVYYRLPKCSFAPVAGVAGLYRFYRALQKGIRSARLENEKFDIVHVHVLTRLGFVALFYKWFRGTPYVITEHWTRYLPLRNEFHGFLRKRLTRMVVKNAGTVTTVSEDLKQAMQRHGLRHPDYRVIYNVVAPPFFEVSATDSGASQERKELVHVSCFTDVHKNISGLLRVVKKLSENRNNFHFTLVGEGEDLEKMKQYAGELHLLPEVVTFTGLLEGRDLAETMAQADALVIFSNYENMPVVINESFVLGVPVFSTDVGGIAEMVNKTNGRLVPKGDEEALTRVLNDFLDGKLPFDRKAVRQQARARFSPEAVGKDLVGIYEDVLEKTNREFNRK